MRALSLFALALALPAFGFESVCFQYPDDSKQVSELQPLTRVGCTPGAGPNTVRHRWVGPLDEHRQLFEQARAAAGLPPGVSATFSLDVFTSDAKLIIGLAPELSLVPVPFEQTRRKQSRPFSLGELSQLPDFSYGLWDWATGDETCPFQNYGDAVACHDFTTHMGAVNSNHFLPQAQAFYLSYHQAALTRADACQAQATALGAEKSRFAPYLEQCELEALALEAVGQHYLQDAWSTGHMWARWGSPEISDFPGTGAEPRDRAELIALVSGLIHGSRGVLQRLTDWAGYDVDDALCAPQDSVRYISEGQSKLGLGDDYLDKFPGSYGDGSPYSHQLTQLMSCAVTGLTEVYQRAGQQHGPLTAPAAGLSSVVLNSPACFGQRVTNLALATGAGLQLKVDGNQLTLPLDARFVSWLVPKLARVSGEVTVEPKLRNEFRLSLMRVTTRLRVLAKSTPEGIEAASGGLGDLIGVKPNGEYLGRSPIASTLEPTLPWPGLSSRPPDELSRASALALLFNRAHASDWCALTDSNRLAALKAHLGDAALDADGKIAACDACVEISARHLRLGTGAGSYDASQEPLCQLLTPGSALLYQPGPDASTAARAWCGCP